MSEIDTSEELLELAFLALDHDVDSVRTGGPLVPFALTESPDGRELLRFAADTLEAGQQQAREHVRTSVGLIRAAIAYDGFLTVEGDRADAIFVEAQEQGKAASAVFAQRYKPGGRLRKFGTIGNAAFVGDGEVLLPSGDT